MEEDQHPNWKALATSNLRWKIFVQARDKQLIHERNKSKSFYIASSFTGEEVKEIYENIVDTSYVDNEEDSRDSSEYSQFAEAPSSSLNDSHVPKAEPNLKFDARSAHKAMMSAQNNDINPLTEMLKNGFNVNSKDGHGWSLLMIAACAGSFDVVQTLLKYKARTGTRDAKGNTAIYLASIKGHNRIVDLLIKSRKRSPQKQGGDEVTKTTAPSSGEATTEFVCDTCQITVKESTRMQHETSIVHQFKLGPSTHKTVYGISPSNKGYQLLVNQGWNTEQGLGPESSGTKFPVKTVLKRNREGIGASSKGKARVSHFGPGDESAVDGLKPSERIMRINTLSKRERRKKKQMEMEKEIKLRRMLSEPDL